MAISGSTIDSVEGQEIRLTMKAKNKGMAMKAKKKMKILGEETNALF